MEIEEKNKETKLKLNRKQKLTKFIIIILDDFIVH